MIDIIILVFVVFIFLLMLALTVFSFLILKQLKDNNHTMKKVADKIGQNVVNGENRVAPMDAPRIQRNEEKVALQKEDNEPAVQNNEDVQPEAVQDEEVSVKKVSAHKKNGMHICKKCYKAVPVSEDVCPYCGAEIEGR